MYTYILFCFLHHLSFLSSPPNWFSFIAYCNNLIRFFFLDLCDPRRQENNLVRCWLMIKTFQSSSLSLHLSLFSNVEMRFNSADTPGEERQLLFLGGRSYFYTTLLRNNKRKKTKKLPNKKWGRGRIVKYSNEENSIVSACSVSDSLYSSSYLVFFFFSKLLSY